MVTFSKSQPNANDDDRNKHFVLINIQEAIEKKKCTELFNLWPCLVEHSPFIMLLLFAFYFSHIIISSFGCQNAYLVVTLCVICKHFMVHTHSHTLIAVGGIAGLKLF